MGVIQVGSATTGGDPNGGGPFSVNKPTGVQENDVLIVFGASNEGTWDTLPSGFTQFAVSADGDTPNAYRGYAWYKICGSSEPSSYSFGSTTAESVGAPMVVVMAAWRGVDTNDPVPDVSEISGGSVSEPANPSTSFTQTTAGRVFYARMIRSTSALPSFSTSTSGWSELGEDAYFSGGTVRYGIGMYARDEDTVSGVQTEPGVTCSVTETDNVYVLAWLKAGPVPMFGNRILAMRAAQVRAHYW